MNEDMIKVINLHATAYSTYNKTAPWLALVTMRA
jgi:hypothetical protein